MNNFNKVVYVAVAVLCLTGSAFCEDDSNVQG